MFSRPSPQLGRLLAGNCPRLGHLRLYYYDVPGDDRRAVALLRAFFLCCPTSLTSISLSCRLPACAALGELFQCWARLPLLANLEVSPHEVDGAGLEAATQLQDIRHGVVSFQRLQRLRMRLCTGHAEHLVAAAPALTELDLTVDMGDRFVLADLAPLTQLRALDVRYNAVTAHPLTPRNVAALQLMGQLRVLGIVARPHDDENDAEGQQQHAARYVTDADFGRLAAALPHLIHLCIEVGERAVSLLTGAALRSVGEHCRSLKSLAVDGQWDMSCWRESSKTPLFPRLTSIELGDLNGVEGAACVSR